MTDRRKFPILVVDDDPNVANTLAMVLQQAGYTAVFALSGSSALELASGIALDLAIVDVNLPGLDGVQTAVRICQRLPKCKILLMSGDTDATPLLERAKTNGINFEVVAKPIPPPELFEKVESLLARNMTKSKHAVSGSQ